MNVIDVIGWAVDGAVYCLGCRREMRKHGDDGPDDESPIFALDDCGPDGLYCECGEEIKPPYGEGR